MFEIPTDIKDITPAIISVDYTLEDADRVRIDHRPQPKGSFAELQRKGQTVNLFYRQTN